MKYKNIVEAIAGSLKLAQDVGVGVLAYDCLVKFDEISVGDVVEVKLQC